MPNKLFVLHAMTDQRPLAAVVCPTFMKTHCDDGAEDDSDDDNYYDDEGDHDYDDNDDHGHHHHCERPTSM